MFSRFHGGVFGILLRIREAVCGKGEVRGLACAAHAAGTLQQRKGQKHKAQSTSMSMSTKHKAQASSYHHHHHHHHQHHHRHHRHHRQIKHIALCLSPLLPH
jgi:hypothetical protein